MKRLAFANYVDPGYGFTFLDAETGKRISQGMITGHDSIDLWDTAFPDYKDPIIVFVAGEMIYEWRHNAIIGKTPAVETVR